MHIDAEVEKTATRRTVIVIDHGSAIANLNNIRIDVAADGVPAPSSSKHRSSSHSSSIGSLSKSVWTVIAEAAVEYCRIIFDLLQEEYMVQLIVSDSSYKKLNTFRKEEQNINQILKGLANIGPPKEEGSEEGGEDGFFAYPGLEAAVISIIESFLPKKDLAVDTQEQASGRIILITSLDSEKETKPLVSRILEIQERYDVEKECSIDLVIVNVSNIADKISKEKKQVSESLSATACTFRAGLLPNKMIMLSKKHFNLRSTSITGIPMKEEQHAGTSANYDVEIIHPAEVHHETYWFCPGNESPGITGSSFAIAKKDNFSKSVITLKWCTPKSSSNNELLQCIGAYRCTPAEVNSRPAACLISFLQQGRTVLLEQPKRSGAKVISHMLVSHGGDVYIHVLATGRNPVEDPPSISEGCGGKVTDYRIEDFGKFMKENRLAPVSNSEGPGEETSIEKAERALSEEERKNWLARTCMGLGTESVKSLSRLERGTRHWPMAISETLVFNMSSQLNPLLSNLVKAKITDEEVQDCVKVIYKLQGMESRNDTLPLPMISMRGKGSKREEQYRQLWAEIDIFIQEAARTSPNHAKVLDCLRGSQESQPTFASTNSSLSSNKDSKSSDQNNTQDLAWKELDKYSQMTEHEKKILNQAPSDPRRRRKNSEPPEETTASKKKVNTPSNTKTGPLAISSSIGPKSNLLAIWSNQLKAVADRRHEEFEGRKNSVDGKAELYPELNKEMNITSLNTSSVKEWV